MGLSLVRPVTAAYSVFLADCPARSALALAGGSPALLVPAGAVLEPLLEDAAADVVTARALLDPGPAAVRAGRQPTRSPLTQAWQVHRRGTG